MSRIPASHPVVVVTDTSGHVGVSVPVEAVRNEWAVPVGICTVRALTCSRTHAGAHAHTHLLARSLRWPRPAEPVRG